MAHEQWHFWGDEASNTNPANMNSGELSNYLSNWTGSSDAYRQGLSAYAQPATQDWMIENNLKSRNALNSTFQASLGTGDGDGKSWWQNSGVIGAIGPALSGIGAIGSAYVGMKNVKLARAAMDQQNDQWGQNFASQQTLLNNEINNRNAWKKAQGRTDFSTNV
jgi:nicotinamide mononucleotide (NMN) deamidase PncC